MSSITTEDVYAIYFADACMLGNRMPSILRRSRPGGAAARATHEPRRSQHSPSLKRTPSRCAATSGSTKHVQEQPLHCRSLRNTVHAVTWLWGRCCPALVLWLYLGGK